MIINLSMSKKDAKEIIRIVHDVLSFHPENERKVLRKISGGAQKALCQLNSGK